MLLKCNKTRVNQSWIIINKEKINTSNLILLAKIHAILSSIKLRVKYPNKIMKETMITFSHIMSIRKKIYKYRVLLIFALMPPKRRLKSIIFLRLGRKVKRKKILVDKERMSMMILMHPQKQKKKIQFNSESIISQQDLNLLHQMSYHTITLFPSRQ